MLEGCSVPTPSDPTAVPEKSYQEMASAAQAAIEEQEWAIEQRKRDFEQLQQAMIPNKEMPPVSGDCVIDGEY